MKKIIGILIIVLLVLISYTVVVNATEFGDITEIIIEGDTTKEIYIDDEVLRNDILKNHDIDSDGRITEKDMINITYIFYDRRGDTSAPKITSIKGLEKAINLESLYLNDNAITDISPIVGLTRLNHADFGTNKITDISCIKNVDKGTNIYLSCNYIDFSEGSKNLEILKNYYSDDKDMQNTIISTQRCSKPEDDNKIVNLDARIKNKLISYGIDKNKDGNLSIIELYEAEFLDPDFVTVIDLSNLGLTDISGLEYLRAYEINLSNNKLTDISIFAKNRNFGAINLSHNKIKDISCFANYNMIDEIIDLSYNEIEDISSIKTWPQILKEGIQEYEETYRLLNINLANNKITDITPVKDFKNIRKLNLSNNKISNIEPLASYDFTFRDTQKEELVTFAGIILDGNLIDKTLQQNKKAIDVFKSKNVKLQIGKQAIGILKDIKETDWYYGPVKYVYNNGIILGKTDTLFKPNDTLTRGQLVTILWRMDGSKIVDNANKFNDVKQGDYYFEAVKWAYSNKVVNGYSADKFAPNNNISREQLAVMLRNYAVYKNKKIINLEDISKYKDSKGVASYSVEAVKWAIGNKIISGKDDGARIDPKGNALRAQAAAMIQNYCYNIK